MPKLDLSRVNPKLRKVNDELFIFDPIRRDYMVLTPEEWVRQRLLLYLLEEYHYPKALIRVESGLRYGKRQKRSDLLIYRPDNLQTWMLIECKAEHIALSENVLQQALTYNKTLKAPFIVLSNGTEAKVYNCAASDRIESLADFPVYPRD